MEVNVLAHILLTICLSIFLFFFGFVCLKKKELVFLTLAAFAVKSLLIYAIFQFPALFDSGFFVDSKAYQAATARTSQYFQIETFFPSNNVYDTWDTQVSYVYILIVNPFYLLFKSASTGFLLNAFFYVTSLVILYRLFTDRLTSRQTDIAFALLLVWPSLFFNSLLFIRDGLILLLLLIFLYFYGKKASLLKFLVLALCVFLEVQIRWYVGLSMVLFIIGDIILAIGRRNRFVFYLLSLGFLVIIVLLVNYLGFTLDTIQGFRNILTGLEGNYNANSVYLQGFIIDNYFKLFLFIPLSVLHFLFSPLIPSGGNPATLLACVENLTLVIMACYAFWPGKIAVGHSMVPILKHSLLFSIPLLLVYSFGVADSGTAMRQKVFLIFIIVFAFFKRREWILKS